LKDIAEIKDITSQQQR